MHPPYGAGRRARTPETRQSQGLGTGPPDPVTTQPVYSVQKYWKSLKTTDSLAPFGKPESPQKLVLRSYEYGLLNECLTGQTKNAVSRLSREIKSIWSWATGPGPARSNHTVDPPDPCRPFSSECLRTCSISWPGQVSGSRRNCSPSSSCHAPPVTISCLHRYTGLSRPPCRFRHLDFLIYL